MQLRLSKQAARKQMCATECSARCHAQRDGRAMLVECNRARFLATRPRVFCELKTMKIVILTYQIIQEKFAYGELFMLVMIGYIFMFKMVKKMQNSGFKIVAGLTRPLGIQMNFCFRPVFIKIMTTNIISRYCIFCHKATNMEFDWEFCL